MTELSLQSAGVSTREIDKSGPVTQEPAGVPAAVIGTARKGPAFVPVTLGVLDDFFARFGQSDGKNFGPLAVSEWLRNASSATYLRVLGTGTGEKRTSSGNTAGAVDSAGFVVGEEQPDEDSGAFVSNSFANENGPLGRTYFLGAYMSESNGSTIFSDAGIQDSTTAAPIVRGIVMAPSGVVLRLSSSVSGITSTAPGTTDVATIGGGEGAITGTVKLLENSVAKEEFVMLLNGHKGTDSNHPNVITASFDVTAQNYFANVFNKDPLQFQRAGHMLYAHYDIHPALAAVTGTGLITASLGADAAGASLSGAESAAFLTTGALDRNTGDSNVPNYENFEDRFDTPRSPIIISQKFGGSAHELFRVHSIDDGEFAAQRIKISIENIAASSDDTDPFGTFDLIVRDIRDDDNDFTPLEEFRGLSLNPRSSRYIAKVIGDQNVFFDFEKSEAGQKLVIDGSFPNRSNWIRVSVDTKVDDEQIPQDSLPFGFRGHPHLVTSGTLPLTDATSDLTNVGDDDIHENGVSLVLKKATQPPVPFRTALTAGEGAKVQANSSLYWGVKFQRSNDLSDLNKGKLFDNTITSLSKYLPDFMTTVQNVVVSDNEGAQDTAENGILDADRFNNNAFTLENVKITTGSDARADTKTVKDWTYVREGGLTADEANKTRGMTADDLKKQSVRPFAKFSFFLQGGFNGVNIFDEDEAKLTDNAIREEIDNSGRGENDGPTVKAYTKAIDILKERSNVDIQLLAIPGIRQPVVTNAAVDAVEDRFDAMYIMDIPERDSLNNIVTSSADQNAHVGNTVTVHTDRNLDTNFAAAYFPDLIMTDPTTSKAVRVPPSVSVLGAFALNDAVGFPWFAPAGFTRGALDTVIEAAVPLNRDNLDELYEADINPIVAFQNSDGPVVWGQKTLQQTQSALDRVNVRRLLIEVRRRIRRVARTILFEPNREATLSRFAAAVRPILDNVQARQGIEKFKVDISANTTSQADVENNTIRGIIMLQPIRAAEFISLDFVVTNQGADI